MKRYVISDLHLADKHSDEFSGNEKALTEFLAPLPDKSVILAGDIFDLLKAKLEDIEKAYPDLIKLIFGKACVYCLGNHDAEMHEYNFISSYRCVPIVNAWTEGETMVMHGHTLDVFNSQAHFVGDTLARITDWLGDRLGKGVYRYARQAEAWARKTGHFGDPKEYRQKAFDLIRPSAIKRIVIGHTHVKDTATQGDLQYLNSGAWINKQRGWVELDF